MRILVAMFVCLLTACCTLHIGDPHDATRTLEFVDGAKCSGTYVKPFVVLTAAHCMQGNRLSMLVNGKVANIERMASDGEDHTLVKVDLESKDWLPVSQNISQGQDFEIWGNPDKFKDLYRRCYAAGKRDGMIALSCNIWFGDSGAGMIRNGKVVGVISGLWVNQLFVVAFAKPMRFTAANWEAVK